MDFFGLKENWLMLVADIADDALAGESVAVPRQLCVHISAVFTLQLQHQVLFTCSSAWDNKIVLHNQIYKTASYTISTKANK